jgi:hypothetical protein
MIAPARPAIAFPPKKNIWDKITEKAQKYFYFRLHIHIGGPFEILQSIFPSPSFAIH